MESLVRKDIARAVAERTGEDLAKVEEIMESSIRVLQEGLIQGKEITLKDFATIRIVEEKARIIADPQTGHQMVRPIRRVVSFRPSPIFQHRIEQAKLSSILLAVPKRSPFVEVLCYHFGNAGWKVYVVHDLEEVRGAVQESGAYLVILDLALEGAEELIRDLKCDPETTSIPIVTLYPSNAEPERPTGLRVLGDEVLTDPFDVQDLLRLTEALLSQASEEQAFFLQQVSFLFPTDELFLEDANDLGARLFSESGLADEAQVAMGAAFREAIGNAAQHGNRDNPGKWIRANYYLDPSRVTVVITDEGHGFNHAFYTQRGEGGSALLAARERHRQGRVGGLGIMLMIRCTDRVQYNDVGNSVTLTRYLAKIGGASKAS